MEWADLVGVERNDVSFLVTVVGGVGSDIAGAGEDESSDKKEQNRRCPHCVFSPQIVRSEFLFFFLFGEGRKKLEEITTIFNDEMEKDVVKMVNEFLTTEFLMKD